MGHAEHEEVGPLWCLEDFPYDAESPGIFVISKLLEHFDSTIEFMLSVLPCRHLPRPRKAEGVAPGVAPGT